MPSVCNATALRQASRRVAQLYDDALAPCGLRSTQYAILTEIDRRPNGPPTMRELAEAIVMDRSALGHALRPLERDGLVTLAPGDDDRRRRYVTITPSGEATLRAARHHWLVAQERFETVFGATAAARLRETLMGIAHNQRLATLAD